MTLDQLEKGKSACIVKVGGDGRLRQHFLDMGMIPGVKVKMMQYAPLGDPMELLIHSYALTLRKADAAQIEIIEAEEDTLSEEVMPPIRNLHPGLGEGGRYHSKDHENPLPKGTTLSFALLGNQNCGKTTLFNVLTGSNQHVGNFPGVTVDRKSGVINGHPGTLVTDLPGIYSLSPYTAEEIISREFILKEKPKGIINIVDAGNIERNLYLTMQLMELGIPMVLALNMMDEVRNNGGSIRVNEMERILGIPVVPISAAKNEGVEELVEHAIHVAKYQEKPAHQDFCGKDDNGGAVHRCLHAIRHLVEDHAEAEGIPVRFAVDRLVEGDEAIEKALKLSDGEKEMLNSVIAQMEAERGLDRAAAMADMRFSFIRDLCRRTVVKPRESKEYKRSRRIDKLLTGKYTALPIFITIMAMIIYLSIDVLGAPLQDLLERGIQGLGAAVGSALSAWGVSEAVVSLVVDGIFGGVGMVVSFVPVIILLFFFLSMLEDSGYMARVAFVTDKLLRRIGLSGRSIVPLLIGFGCSVPAVMATRTLPSTRDRRRTILLTPYISCSAKIPIYAFFTSAFFPGKGGLVLACLYVGAILVGTLVAYLGKFKRRSDDVAPFVMELPNYRMPGMKNVALLLWDKTKDFLQFAFTIIFLASILVWALQSFDFRLNLCDGEDSMLAGIAGLLSPVFAPLGLSDWRFVAALLTGFISKESVVSTLTILGASAAMTLSNVIPMLVFCLLYTPCVAAITAVKRELGVKWAIYVVAFQCAIAWVCALAANLIVSAII